MKFSTFISRYRFAISVVLNTDFSENIGPGTLLQGFRLTTVKSASDRMLSPLAPFCFPRPLARCQSRRFVPATMHFPDNRIEACAQHPSSHWSHPRISFSDNSTYRTPNDPEKVKVEMNNVEHYVTRVKGEGEVKCHKFIISVQIYKSD
jgi:hypothetical protein